MTAGDKTPVPPAVGELLPDSPEALAQVAAAAGDNAPPVRRHGLTPFEGKPVYSATVAIRNAGDGLSSAMEVEPVELHHGDVVHVVLECEVDKLRFDPIKDTDGFQRVHMLKAGRATMIDAAAVADALDSQQRRIEEAEGVQQLPFGEDGQGEDGEGEDPDVEPDPESDDLADLAEDPGAGL